MARTVEPSDRIFQAYRTIAMGNVLAFTVVALLSGAAALWVGLKAVIAPAAMAAWGLFVQWSVQRVSAPGRALWRNWWFERVIGPCSGLLQLWIIFYPLYDVLD